MHDIKFFEEKTELVKANLAKRNYDLSQVDKAIDLNKKRKELTKVVENTKAEINSLSREVGNIKKTGGDASELMAKVATLKKAIADNETLLETTEKEMNSLLSIIPNLIGDDVPVAADESGNKEIHRFMEPTKLSFKAKEHFELGESLGMIDFDRGAKLTGARFVILRKDIARLERALINFMLEDHAKHGYEEIVPPYIVNAESLYGTGQLPKFAEDLFKLEGRDWYLIPTAEVPVTNIKRGELFDGKELPMLMTAYTPCFRSEAGSHGRDTKGLIRMHQFNKVELVNIVAADKSNEAHENMIKRACAILEALKLPYRAMLLCSGDMGFGSRKTIDLEVWLPGQDKYREISSISNCWDFQARRAGIRYRNAEGKPEFAHTLNGSGLAVGRTVVAIMENYQQEDGSIVIPEVLRPYMGGQSLITLAKK